MAGAVAYQSQVSICVRGSDEYAHHNVNSCIESAYLLVPGRLTPSPNSGRDVSTSDQSSVIHKVSSVHWRDCRHDITSIVVQHARFLAALTRHPLITPALLELLAHEPGDRSVRRLRQGQSSRRPNASGTTWPTIVRCELFTRLWHYGQSAY